MHRQSLLRAIARVTNEPIARLRRMGFQLVTPGWDDGEGHRALVTTGPVPRLKQAARLAPREVTVAVDFSRRIGERIMNVKSLT